MFLEELEPKVKVLDPRQTTLVRDGSKQHRAGLLYIESLLREVAPPDDGLYVGYRGAMDVLDFQLEPAARALERPRARILIASTCGGSRRTCASSWPSTFRRPRWPRRR